MVRHSATVRSSLSGTPWKRLHNLWYLYLSIRNRISFSPSFCASSGSVGTEVQTCLGVPDIQILSHRYNLFTMESGISPNRCHWNPQGRLVGEGYRRRLKTETVHTLLTSEFSLRIPNNLYENDIHRLLDEGF